MFCNVWHCMGCSHWVLSPPKWASAQPRPANLKDFWACGMRSGVAVGGQALPLRYMQLLILLRLGGLGSKVATRGTLVFFSLSLHCKAESLVTFNCPVNTLLNLYIWSYPRLTRCCVNSEVLCLKQSGSEQMRRSLNQIGTSTSLSQA